MEDFLNESVFGKKYFHADTKSVKTQRFFSLTQKDAIKSIIRDKYGADDKGSISDKFISRVNNDKIYLYYTKDKPDGYYHGRVPNYKKDANLTLIDSGKVIDMCKKYDIKLEFNNYDELDDKLKTLVSNAHIDLDDIMKKVSKVNNKAYYRPTEKDIIHDINDFKSENSISVLRWDIWKSFKNARSMSDEENDSFFKDMDYIVRELNNRITDSDFKIEQDGDWDGGSIYLASKKKISKIKEDTVLNDISSYFSKF